MGNPREADLPFTDDEIEAARAANPPPPPIERPTWPEPQIIKLSPLQKDASDLTSPMNKEAATLRVLYDIIEE